MLFPERVSRCIQNLRILIKKMSDLRESLPTLLQCLGLSYLGLIIVCSGGGGREATPQSFIRRGSAPRSKSSPFYIPFLREKEPLSYAFRMKFYPFHIPTERVLLNFSLRKPLKYLDDSAVRCVCSRYFEIPF